MIDDWVYSFFYYTMTTIGIGVWILYGWWCFLIWRKTRKPAYLWLMLGVSIVPLCQTLSLYVSQFIPMALPRWITAHRLVNYSISLSQSRTLVLSLAIFVCLFAALGQLGGGCVRFRDLFRPLKKPAQE